MDEDRMDELVVLLRHAYDTLGEDAWFVYLDIQKIFYHLQNRLDDDNAIAEMLPYYWYIDGPVSDSVQQAVFRAREQGVIHEEPTPNGGSLFRQIPEQKFEIEARQPEDLEEALDAIEEVLDEDYDVYSEYEDKLSDVYTDAPFEFQRYCKFELYPAIKEFEDDIPWHFSAGELGKRVSTAESYLPIDSRFESFNALYSRYATLADRYFEIVDEDSKIGSSLFLDLTEEMWKLFCHQLRVVAHDEYYDKKQEYWKVEYEQKEKSFASKLVQFEEFIHTEFKSQETQYDKEVHRLAEDSSWGKVASQIIGE